SSSPHQKQPSKKSLSPQSRLHRKSPLPLRLQNRKSLHTSATSPPLKPCSSLRALLPCSLPAHPPLPWKKLSRRKSKRLRQQSRRHRRVRHKTRKPRSGLSLLSKRSRNHPSSSCRSSCDPPRNLFRVNLPASFTRNRFRGG